MLTGENYHLIWHLPSARDASPCHLSSRGVHQEIRKLLGNWGSEETGVTVWYLVKLCHNRLFDADISMANTWYCGFTCRVKYSLTVGQVQPYTRRRFDRQVRVIVRLLVQISTPSCFTEWTHDFEEENGREGGAWGWLGFCLDGGSISSKIRSIMSTTATIRDITPGNFLMHTQQLPWLGLYSTTPIDSWRCVDGRMCVEHCASAWIRLFGESYEGSGSPCRECVRICLSNPYLSAARRTLVKEYVCIYAYQYSTDSGMANMPGENDPYFKH